MCFFLLQLKKASNLKKFIQIFSAQSIDTFIDEAGYDANVFVSDRTIWAWTNDK